MLRDYFLLNFIRRFEAIWDFSILSQTLEQFFVEPLEFCIKHGMILYQGFRSLALRADLD